MDPFAISSVHFSAAYGSGGSFVREFTAAGRKARHGVSVHCRRQLHADVRGLEPETLVEAQGVRRSSAARARTQPSRRHIEEPGARQLGDGPSQELLDRLPSPKRRIVAQINLARLR